jgi:23S rRNA (cytidine1920-2'-O)/16S rRNA (cytidine1409-2'-O)-methyltransferase
LLLTCENLSTDGATVRRRLDAELVRRALVASREQAQAAITAGRVLVGGAIADKASRQVDASEPVEITGPPPRFVGRGGDKLDGALEHFAVDVTGLACLDAGASTGGFTDCLLQRGAASVLALDVGHGQLHERLRRDHRVEVRERENVRHMRPEHLDGRQFQFTVADLSFISLTVVAEALVGLTVPGGQLVVLIKPQFEATRAEVSRGSGVIRDAAVWEESLCRVIDAFAGHGAAMMGLMVSPIRGADGNVEFLTHLRNDGSAIDIAGDVAARRSDIKANITADTKAAITAVIESLVSVDAS